MIDQNLLANRDAIVQLLEQAGTPVDGANSCLCPFHGDDNPSAGIYYKDGRWRFNCFACQATGDYYDLKKMLEGKSIKDVAAEAGNCRAARPLPPPVKKMYIEKYQVRLPTDAEINQLANSKGLSPAALKKFAPIVYRDQPVALLPAFEPCDLTKACGFLRVRLDGEQIELASGRTAKYPILSGSRHGLLGLRWAIRQSGDIWFCEAWRDALAIIESGQVAVASTGGASTWQSDWLPAFAGRDVLICFDADEPGQKAALRAADAIVKVAKSVNIAELPYEIRTKHGKDLYDYLDGDTK